MSYKIHRFGASQLIPDYNGSQDIGTGKVRIEATDGPRGGAFDALGKEQTFRGGYSLKTSGILNGQNAIDLNTKFNKLRSLLGKREKLWRVDDLGSMQWAWARLESVNSTRQIVHRQHLEIDLSFFVFSALWSGELHGSWRLDDGNALDDGNNLDTDLVYVLNETTKVLSITNGGNSVLRNLEMIITPKGAPISAIQISKDGETSLSWVGSISVETSLVIDFGAMSIKNNGVNAYSGLNLTSEHKIDDWIRLDPGDNFITVMRTGGDVTSQLAVIFYDGWV